MPYSSHPFPSKFLKKIAKRGKTSTGYFYGFKLHLIINDKGKILAYILTLGNAETQVPVSDLSKSIFGTMFAGKECMSHQLFIKLYDKGLEIINRLRKKMKNKLMSLVDKIFIKKAGVIGSVNNKLKNSCQIEHRRHCSLGIFLPI